MRVNKNVSLAYDIIRLLKRTDKPLRSEDIARSLDASLPFIQQILLKLKRSLMVSSIRGPNGGYKIVSTGYNVTALDVAHSLGYCLTYVDSSDLDKEVTMALSRIVL